MTPALINTVAPALLTGGLVAALVSLYTAKKKVPAERDSIVVSGAETAVMTLERTLSAETRRADRAEQEVKRLHSELVRKDDRILALESRLDQLQDALDQARAELHSILSPKE